MSNTLIIHWPYLLVALAMLWFPRQWLRVGRWYNKKRSRPKGPIENFTTGPAHDPADKSVNLRRELMNKRNYLDILRAATGTVALLTYGFEAHGPTAAIVKSNTRIPSSMPGMRPPKTEHSVVLSDED